jgi:hypothetical protein
LDFDAGEAGVDGVPSAEDAPDSLVSRKLGEVSLALERRPMARRGAELCSTARPAPWQAGSMRFPPLPLLSLFLVACAAPESGPESRAIALFDGQSLAGWNADVPAADAAPDLRPSFVARDGLLVSLGSPEGHLITEGSFRDYRLSIEYRWPGEPGNCGVLVHASTPRRLYGMFPQSIEVQLHSGNAGDFWCIGEDIAVPDMIARRGPPETWGVDGERARRIANLTDGSERPAGQWNLLEIECRADTISVWVNGDPVNFGSGCTANAGRIALQAEGALCEFRRIDLLPL